MFPPDLVSVIKPDYNLLQRNEIQFDNIPDAPDRFVLQVGKQKVPTQICKIVKDADIQIYAKGKKLFVEAGENILKVTVINIQGVTQLNSSVVNSRNFSASMNLPSGVYIINVILTTGENKVEKIVFKE